MADPTLALPLLDLALAAVGARVQADPALGPEAAFLDSKLKALSAGAASLAGAIAEALAHPRPADERLVHLAHIWGFSPAEVLAVSLAAGVDRDVMTGRAIAFAQAPLAGSRPTLGLLAESFRDFEMRDATGAAFLGNGPAVQTGLLTLLNEGAPYPERPVAVPLPLALALAGEEAPWPGGAIGGMEGYILLPAGITAACRRQAEALRAEDSPVLVIRAAAWSENRAAAAAVADALGLRPYYAENPTLPGLTAWLLLRNLLPVFLADPGPGETKSISPPPYYRGPALVIAGMDGSIEYSEREVVNWPLPFPSLEERETLWKSALPNVPGVTSLALGHRQSAARIAQLGRLATHRARFEGRTSPEVTTVREVARSGEGSGLDSLAQPLPERVADDALVLSAELRLELEALLARCRQRDGLPSGLGAAAVARYTSGVKALFSGPSGTGKTLAACWLATRLGLPLFRVDLASVTSKYIGETEKNLARLLARAERTEVILLFDEADSLFGKRTDVRDANDRFANAQTNYLLQRIETFDGIALLTSNSRGNFDSAFSRRLDVIIEFPVPSATERRALWQAHLGPESRLSDQELNLLAGQCDFAGGQIRNIVLAGAVDAREVSGPLDFPKILRALVAEYKKGSRSVPPGLLAAKAHLGVNGTHP